MGAWRTWAHISGYFYGFVVGMGLLWIRLLPREPYDMLSMRTPNTGGVQEFRSLTQRGLPPLGAGSP